MNQSAFPYDMPEEKPDRPLSAAVARNYDAYMGARPETNPLYTQFKYTRLVGFDYNGGDGTITRSRAASASTPSGRAW